MMKKPDFPEGATDEEKAQINKDFRADITEKRNMKEKPKLPAHHA